MKKQKGFTLIEVIVVIAIIGILSSIVAPQISKYKERSKEKQRVEYKLSIDKAIRQCYALEGKLPESIQYMIDNNYILIDEDKYECKYNVNREEHTYSLTVEYK